MRTGGTAGPRPPDSGSVWREGTVIVGKVLNPAWPPPGTAPALLHLPEQQNVPAKGKHTDPRFGQLSGIKDRTKTSELLACLLSQEIRLDRPTVPCWYVASDTAILCSTAPAVIYEINFNENV
ncbi:unnamed protein product [Coccothraustes coccothraustes]